MYEGEESKINRFFIYFFCKISAESSIGCKKQKYLSLLFFKDDYNQFIYCSFQLFGVRIAKIIYENHIVQSFFLKLSSKR
jgi:hypothetical protein